MDWLEVLERAEKKNYTHNTPPSKEKVVDEKNPNAYGVRTDKTDKSPLVCKKHRVRDCEPCYRELDRVVDQGMKPKFAMQEIYVTEEQQSASRESA